LKLVPTSGKLELRIKGPNIMPGYWRDAAQSAKAFDEDGFYMIGDALRFHVDGDPNGGFVFDGRISEDFKLVTGTWVSVGPLRARLITEFAPFVKDVVIAGHDRDAITAMLFPDTEACRHFVGGDVDENLSLEASDLRAELAARLRAMSQKSTGSSTRVARVLLLREPPSIDANEITDKGSINQRAVLARRKALVDALYAETPPADVISV
jgi:feruloyl-CoA synthase